MAGWECWVSWPQEGWQWSESGVRKSSLRGDSVIGLTKPREKPCEWEQKLHWSSPGTRGQDVEWTDVVDVGVSNGGGRNSIEESLRDAWAAYST